MGTEYDFIMDFCTKAFSQDIAIVAVLTFLLLTVGYYFSTIHVLQQQIILVTVLDINWIFVFVKYKNISFTTLGLFLLSMLNYEL